MRYLCKLLLSLALVGLSAEVACAQTNVTAASGSLKIAGTPISTGSIVFVPVDSSGNGIAVTYASGVTVPPYAQPKTGIPLGFTCAVSSGAISGSCPVPDTATSSPEGFAYNITFVDLNSGKYGSLNQVRGVTGVTWALDHYQPSSVIPATGSYTVTYGSGAPVGTFGAGSFYFDVSTISSPVMYASVNGVMQQVGGSISVWASLSGNGAPSPSSCGPTSYSKPYTDVSVTPNVLYTCGTDGWAVRSAPPTLSNRSGTGLFAYPGLNLFGDSITCANGASSTSKGYASLLQSAFGGVSNNYCRGGDQAADMAEQWVYPNLNPGYNAQPATTMMIGVNDALFCGASAGCQSNYRHALQASLYWASIPNQVKVIFGSNTQVVTTTGTWSSLSTPQPNMALAATSSGSTLTFTTLVPSPYLYLAWQAIDGSPASANLTCDSGAVTDTLAGAGYGGQTIHTQNGNVQTVFANRYQFAASTIHTCTVNVAEATSGSPFVLVWAGQPQPSSPNALAYPTANGPRVFVGGVIQEASGTNSSTNSLYNSIALSVATQAVSDGLPVVFVDTRDAVNTTSDMANTSTTLPNGAVCPASTLYPVHPNDCGHQHIADAFLAVAQPVSAAAGNTFSSLNLKTSATNSAVELNLSAPGVNQIGLGAWATGSANGLPGVVGLYDNTLGQMLWNTNTAGHFCLGTLISNVGTCSGDHATLFQNGTIEVLANAPYTFSSSATDASVARDTGLSRISAGVVGFGNGNAGDFSGSVQLHTINPNTSANADAVGTHLTGPGLNDVSISGWTTGNPNGLSGVWGSYDNTTGIFVWAVNTTDDLYFGVPVSGAGVGTGVGAKASILHDGSATFSSLGLSGSSFTCNSANAGRFNYVAGAAGVKDSVQVCAKDATNAYAFRTIY